MEQYLKVAVDAAIAAGKLLCKRIDSVAWIEHKGDINLVTEMDVKSEELIKNKIRAAFPDHQIMAEESDIPKQEAEHRWIIDPLDGTTNYAHGFPIFCVSIALEIKGVIEVGAVYDPSRDELFSSVRGGGAFLNGKKIGVSKTASLNESLLATGFPYDLRESKANNLDHWNKMLIKAQAVRRAGSAALDMCYAACGRFDGFWELKLFPWDVAAGSLIVAEAGGKVTDFGGEPFSVYAKEVLASNGKIHQAMVDILKTGNRP